MAEFSFQQIGDVDLVEVYEFCDEPVLFCCRDRYGRRQDRRRPDSPAGGV